MNYKTNKTFKKYLPKNDSFEYWIVFIALCLFTGGLIASANQWQVKPIIYQPVKVWQERDIFAYNVGDPRQTDATPCIGATGEDLCRALANGQKIVALNFLPLGSLIEIKGLGIYRVADRKAKKHPQSIDIAFPSDQYQEAMEFGIKQLDVKIIK